MSEPTIVICREGEYDDPRIPLGPVRVLKSKYADNPAIGRMIGRECLAVHQCPWGLLWIADPKDKRRPQGWLFSRDEYELLEAQQEAE